MMSSMSAGVVFSEIRTWTRKMLKACGLGNWLALGMLVCPKVFADGLGATFSKKWLLPSVMVSPLTAPPTLPRKRAFHGLWTFSHGDPANLNGYSLHFRHQH